MQYKTCPKCGAKSKAAEQCSTCGIYYAKWFKAHLGSKSTKDKTQKKESKKLQDWFLTRYLLLPWSHVEETIKPFELYGRAILLVGMIIWGWLIIGTDPRITTGLFPELSFYSPVIGSFVLVFHEAGHVIFSFFGRFMAVAGGTLMQLIVPSVLMFTFVYKYKNPFGAVVAMWILGFAFISIGPYCYDAQDMELLLVGGGTGREIGGHDWRNLLTWTNSLDHYESIALFFDTLGELIIIVSVALGIRILRLQYNNLDRSK